VTISYVHEILFYFKPQVKRPQMTVVPDVTNVFLPLPTYQFIGHYSHNKDNINQLLETLPVMFSGNLVTDNAMGAAINAALLALVLFVSLFLFFQSIFIC
jgi:hypothetical protein